MKKASVVGRIVERLKGFAEALEQGANVKERFTCRQMVLDLKPLLYTPAAVLKIREELGASQAVFAQLLGVSRKTVQSWEQGLSAPGGMACRWLAEIKRHPDYWRERLKEAIVSRGPKKTSRRLRAGKRPERTEA